MRTLWGGVLGKVPRPTPAMVVALFALLVAASGAAVAAGSFTASDGTITACRDSKTGVLRVVNAQGGQACSAKETTITWKDGITGKVADSDKLDGIDSAGFLGKNEQAADSAKLGGQAPSAYGGVITGRINGVSPSLGQDEQGLTHAAASGISDATTNRSSVQTLSPGRDVVLRDFTAKLTRSSSDFFEEDVLLFKLRIDRGGEPANGHYQLCQLVNQNFTCDASQPVVIPAGSVISLEMVNRASLDTDVLFGYRLTTT